MKTLQLVIWKLICVGLVAGGIALVRFPSSELYHLIAVHIPPNVVLRITVGAVVVLAGVIGLAPGELVLRRKGRTISFPSAAGNVTIELACVQADLSSTISKLPEVRKASIQVLPAEDGQKVRIVANVTLRKGAGASARDAGHQLREAIAQAARRILGGDEVTTVDLNVRGLTVDADETITASVEPRESRGEPVAARPIASPARSIHESDTARAASEPEDIEPLIPGAVSPGTSPSALDLHSPEPTPWIEDEPAPSHLPEEAPPADSDESAKKPDDGVNLN